MTPSKPLPAALNGENVLVTVETGRTEGPVLTVPVAAIVTTGSGTSYVTVAGATRQADPGRGHAGHLRERLCPGDPGAGRQARGRRQRGGERLMIAPVIELHGLARTYPGPPPVHALRPADLVIGAGDYVAVTGPSGSGKSTLLHLLGLLDTPTSGSYLLDGLDTSDAARPGPVGAARQADRDRLPGLPPAGLPDGAGERAARRTVQPDLARHPAARRRPARSVRSGWGTGSTRCRPRCPAGSASGSRSRGRWSTGRACCCATSRRETWTRGTPPR